ncbi:MAG: N-6 DNA methylase [Chloroflexi bacterium]|nr:N-6 DNA methylase [Chloroflexota bacterium]
MTKETKFVEKAARAPDLRDSKWAEFIGQYLRDMEGISGEAARSQRFAMLLHELLGLQPGFVESFISGIEKYLSVKEKDRVLKGRVDNLFGNVILEFERNIPKKRTEAEEQLRRYAAMLWSQERPGARAPYLCLASDGVRFIVYSPTIVDPSAEEIPVDAVGLSKLEEADWTKLMASEVYFWLDRYFLRQEKLRPTTETIVRDFGIKSHAFQTSSGSLMALWHGLREQGPFVVVYDGWKKYLQIVYGSEVAGEDLFVRHTYLATLAKLMSWTRLTENAGLPEEARIVELLEGRIFRAQGIENFIEEDFFSWLAREDALTTGVGITRWLFSLLQNYHLQELSEDVLKSLYQELVDPETRHDLGEFYTPDWLAHRMVNKLQDINAGGSMFDPACGSGTFLYLAIREKRSRLGDSPETLSHILDSVYGTDVHPLAVAVAKTNFILALGDLLKKRKGPVTIPVYLADTLKLPKFVLQGTTPIVAESLVPQLPGYELDLDGFKVYLPAEVVKDPSLYDRSVELMKEFARQNKGNTIALEAFQKFLKGRDFPKADAAPVVQMLFEATGVLKRFIDADRDTIWAFILKNSYKPLFLKRKFDFLMGNPPWIAFRFMEPGYQAFLKRQITADYRLLRGRGELITHMEIATLFLVRAADLYLKERGTIAFVLPRSVFTADQHHGLRERSFTFSEYSVENLFWREIWDLEPVRPLFNVPACVVVADRKEFDKQKYPVAGQILSGTLLQKNAPLAEAEKSLTAEDVRFSLNTRGKRSFWATGKEASKKGPSYYKTRFAQGATIVPRSFWFVRVRPSPLGFDHDMPPMETDPRATEEAKEAYKDVKFHGQVESRFLYATLLSTDLVPFGNLGYRLVVLPLEPQGDHFRLLDSDEAHERGFFHLREWVDRAQAEWERRRGEKAARTSALDWLDYRKKLTSQNPHSKYRVIYPDINRVMLATVLQTERPISIPLGDQELDVSHYVTDCKNYVLETEKAGEAYYLSAVLNSTALDALLQPFRRRGQKGHPDVHKKIFDVASIPQFDAKNAVHLRLARLSRECGKKVAGWLAGGGPGEVKSIGKVRSMVRDVLANELHEIDDLVRTILK